VLAARQQVSLGNRRPTHSMKEHRRRNDRFLWIAFNANLFRTFTRAIRLLANLPQ
jgi:hypothetical protein